MNFTFSSGPSYVLTWIGLTGYAFYIHADFSAYATWIVTLFGLHAGKRLWQKLKDPRIGLEMEQCNEDKENIN